MRGVVDSSAYFKTLEANDAARIAPAAGGRVASNEEKGFFGTDGASFRDVLDAVNPLNHIPGVSDVLESETGHKVSTAAKLAGGALLGGPIGFVASLIDAVFEQATGKSVIGTAYAALTGDTTNDTIQVASAEAPGNSETMEVAENTVGAAPVDDIQVEDKMAQVAPAAGKAKAVPIEVADNSSLANQDARDQAVLALYGSSPASAHSSYRKAQMRPYLHDVTVSQVL